DDREEADDPEERPLVREPEHDHRADDDDAVNRVRPRHEWRVQERRDLRDHLEAEEDREHEDRDLKNQQRVVAHVPGRLSLPPGGAGLRERLTALAARSCALGARSYWVYCPSRLALGSLARRRPRNASELTRRPPSGSRRRPS